MDELERALIRALEEQLRELVRIGMAQNRLTRELLDELVLMRREIQAGREERELERVQRDLDRVNRPRSISSAP